MLAQGSSGRRFAVAFERAATRIEPLLPVVLFFAMVAAARWWRVYQLDSDEGFNLMKGALVANGYSLYSEIWSDQPPVLTFILAAVHRVFPFDVDAARTAVLAFSGLLLWSLFRSIRRVEGRACAWLAVAVLMAVPAFQTLSVSAMIGLPALALASAALDQVLAGAPGDRYWRYLLAGALFALALQTKLFAVLVFPTLALAAFHDADGRLTTLRIGLARLACVVLGTASVFFAIAAAVGEPFVAQLVVPHYRASIVSDTGGIAYFFMFLTYQVPLFVFLLFLLGLVALSRAVKAARLVSCRLASMAAAVLLQHRPLFGHQLALIYPPMAWIAVLSFILVPQGVARRSVATAGVLVLAVIGVWGADAWGRRLSGSLASRDAWRYPVLLAGVSPDSWVVADRLIDAYRAGRLVPPDLAVWSDKRQDAGLLPPKTIISTLEARRPERLLLRRFYVPREVHKYLDAAYSSVPVVQPVPSRQPVRVYVRATANPGDAARSTAAEALLTATEALRSFSPDGGFAGHYTPQVGTEWGRAGEPMEGGMTLIRPPGSTQEVGSCLLRAHRITGAPLFWDAAKQAGNAIACSQGRHGGWAAVAHPNETCEPHGGSQADDAIETLDDGASQSAVRFLMDLAAAQATKTDRPPSWLADGIDRGLGFLLLAQDENGGWPQQFPKSDEDGYSNYATLNDGVITETISTLLRAYRQTGRKRYRAAAERGGDFLLEAQGASSQPATSGSRWSCPACAREKDGSRTALSTPTHSSKTAGPFSMRSNSRPAESCRLARP